MRNLLLSICLGYSFSALAMNETEALAVSKMRIAELSQSFSGMAYNCFMFEEDCGISSNSQSATIKWLSWEASEFKPDIQYSSDQNSFDIDGAIRVARTGLSPGVPVVFNEKLIVVDQGEGSFRPLDFFEIIGVLVHEYGHHQTKALQDFGMPTLEHHELDELAVRVVSYLKDRTRQVRLTKADVPGLQDDFELTIYQTDIEWYNGIRNIWSQVYIDSNLETKEVSQSLMAGLECPKRYTDGHLTFAGEPAYASFRKVQAPEITSDGSRVYIDQDVGEASVLCVDKQMGAFDVFSGYTNGHVRFEFSLEAGGTLRYLDSSRFTADMPE